MSFNQSSTIKRAQKESLLLHELSRMILQVMLDDKLLEGLSVNRVSLSAGKSVCTVFLYTAGGHPEFQEKLKRLVLYKPSLRKAIGNTIQFRYVPELVFKFDDRFDKQQKIDAILDTIKDE